MKPTIYVHPNSRTFSIGKFFAFTMISFSVNFPNRMRKSILLLVALLLVAVPSALIAAGKTDRILRIEVTGNEKIDTAFILNTVTSKENETYSLDKVKEDLRKIYKTGFFSDVQIDVKDTDNGKIVTFIVIERPTIKSISISGNKQIKTADITDKLKIKTNTVLNIDRIKESLDEVRKLYAGKGYYAVKVNYDIAYGERNDSTVTFKIEEPQQAYINKIVLTGNKVFKSSALKQYMKTKEHGLLSWFTGSGILEEDSLEDDRKNLEAYYHDNGYVKINVGVPDVTVSKDGKKITITIPIEEGPLYKTGSIEFSGETILPTAALAPQIKSKSGSTFRSSLLQTDVLTLTDLCQNQGFAFCEVSPLTYIDDSARTVSISFRTVKGQEVYFNRVNILGNLKTRDKVIRRELKIAEGDRFSASQLKESKRKLKNTTFFKDADIKISKTEDPTKVNVDLTVEERPTGSISFGLGYSSSENALISGSVQQDNFLGTGRKIILDAAIGGVTQQFRLSLFEPYVFDKLFSAGFSVFNFERSMDTYDYKKTGVNLSVTRPLSEYLKAGLKYRVESVDVYNVTLDASTVILRQEGRSSTSAIGGSISKNSIDDVMNPTKGVNADLSVEVAGGPLGASNSFVSFIGTYGRYFPIKFLESAFFVRGTAGMIRGYGGKEIPIYEKFYVGGLNSIRGFRYGEAGPMDTKFIYTPVPAAHGPGGAKKAANLVTGGTGEPLGSDNEMFFNFEWIFPISKSAGLKGVLFADTGCGFDSTDPFRLRKAAGFGIRWLSPMGPLRLELGFNLDKQEGERSNAFEFAIGTQY